MNLAIVTDSSCDLSDEQLRENGIRMLPLRVVTDGREYRDRLEMSEDELYAALQSRPVKTNLPSPEDLGAIYDQLAEEGYTEAVHLSISSGLSGTCAMARRTRSRGKRTTCVRASTCAPWADRMDRACSDGR